MFPSNGASGSATGGPTLVRVARNPPQLNSAPPFRRTVRQLANLNISGTTNFTLGGPVVQDASDYGTGSSPRYQTVFMHGVRIYGAVTGNSIGASALTVQVPNLLGSGGNDVSVFSDTSATSNFIVVAFKYPKAAQQQVLSTATLTTVLFVCLNTGGANLQLTVDYDMTFAG
jgi:hypothetical protein